MIVIVTDMQLTLDRTTVEFGTLVGCTNELGEGVIVRNEEGDQAELLGGGSADGAPQVTGGFAVQQSAASANRPAASFN